MIAIDFKTKWIEEVEREREYFESPTDHFDNWERNGGPEIKADWHLANALCILYGDGDKRLAEKFFCATIELIDRAFAEDKFHSEFSESGLPRNQGEGLRVRSYARALMGSGLDTQALLQASEYFVEWTSDWTGADWDSQAQSDYLVAVRMALIAGNIKRASELLKTRRSFKWHAEEHTLLKAITSEFEKGIPIANVELHQRVVAFFDRIRDPGFKPDIFFPKDMGRLEWGVLSHKYFTAGDDIDWPAVIDSISR